MSQKELSKATDKESQDKAKKERSKSILTALVIGIMIGVIIYSVAQKNVSFLTLIPLYFIYRLVNQSKDEKGL